MGWTDMNLEFHNKKVLVTGSSRGIGWGVAKAFLSKGARVCVSSRHCRDHDFTTSLKAGGFSWGEVSSRFLACDCDFTDPASVIALRDTLQEEWGGIDILICNVGSGRGSKEALPSWHEFQASFLVNFASAYHPIEHFMDQLIAVKGNIILIGSIAGLESIGAPTAYSVSKAALTAFCREIARKFGASGVRVNMIAPGNIFHEGGTWDQKLRENETQTRQMLNEKVPLQKFGNPEDIAAAATLLASDKSSFTTGAIWVIDGGQTVGLS
jgi:3-oxoacyl-[acyl-carrier protein] reductase